MSDFLSIEESAEQLGINDSLLRTWIKRGLARATRRGGDYALRPEEVRRLLDQPPERLTTSERPHLSERPRVDSPPDLSVSERSSNIPPIPPEAKNHNETKKLKVMPPRSEKNPESFAGERERRRRMGRRASDFTLEILHQEIKNAIAAALEPVLPRLEAIENKTSSPVITTVTTDYYDTEALESRILELESQLQHQEMVREEFRQRLETSENRRQEIEHSLKAVQQAEEQSLEQRQQHEEKFLRRNQQLLQQLSQEKERYLESEQNLKQALSELQQAQTSSLTTDAERARWNLEERALQGEIDRLNSLQLSWEEQKKQWEQAQQHLKQIEKNSGDNQKIVDDKNLEIRSLREQITSLTYRLQMAGSGGTGTSPEESRQLMERLAEAQTEMNEKNLLITQNYSEISELRSRLDDTQRNFYELQQRHERLKEEWGQLVAQMTSRQMSEHQQQQVSSPPGPGDRNKGWGSLFGRRD